MDLLDRIKANAKASIRKRTFHLDFDGGKLAFNSFQTVVAEASGPEFKDFRWRVSVPSDGGPPPHKIARWGSLHDPSGQIKCPRGGVEKFVYICDFCNLIAHLTFDQSAVSRYLQENTCNSDLRFISLRDYLSCQKRAARTYPCQNQTWPSKRCTCFFILPTRPCGCSSCPICRRIFSPSA